MRKTTLFILAGLAACTAASDNPDVARWEAQARNVTITRDDWGIAHIRGKTDADAVFGMVYAQAEDDFNRVETNYINSMGRLAEAEGEDAVFRDLRMKMFIDPDSMKALYATSPEWLKTLMNAFADGLNYFVYKHPEVKPRVITKFEPWMALTFSEGSIGGDIESISLPNLRAFYRRLETPSIARNNNSENTDDTDQTDDTDTALDDEPRGSNGIAIAPSNTTAKRALLLINPHTSFFFRSELQMTSDDGLNAYGAVTWGQFFVYQGFNERAGWMHTSSGADNIDEYAETIVRRGDSVFYRYGSELRPVRVSKIVVPFKTDTGMARREFTVYRTHHGPVVKFVGDKWITTRLMEEPVKALTQSYARTKARNLKEYRESMELHTNSSNNTLYANADGDIAYFHSNFVPKRDTKFNWENPVDGSNPATEWKGVHSFDESPNVVNPPVGWTYNTNNWPYTASGPDSPKAKDFAAYFESGGENPRGIHAIRVLENKKDFTLDGLMAAAYDSYLPAFADLIPPLLASYDNTPASNPLKAQLAEQIAELRKWDFRWSESSIPTALAVFWADSLLRRVAAKATAAKTSAMAYATSRASAQERLESLRDASAKLAADFGSWKTPWGDINRFQRLTDDIVHPFHDEEQSIPVAFTSATWGSLASFGARPYQGSKKWYGTSGNSFVAVVEFGDSVRAKAITAGGQSGDVKSKHFNDQAQRYSTGQLRDVYFYPSQLRGHIEREYRPGK
ncbi:MAG TPA: penicillin acylase family protein [Gemmatimonadaceae bacterium]|nr:penicillin acylase family protein [Gemmatimonadaceae bacterium]